jgi:hypothetical protein
MKEGYTVENEEYVPTLAEWDELVLLWNRSRTMFSSTLAIGVVPRAAWVTKNFVEAHPGRAPHRAVYAWLTKNLEVARGSSPASGLKATVWHDEPTAVHKRASKGTPHEHITTSAGPDAPEALAACPRVHRQG